MCLKRIWHELWWRMFWIYHSPLHSEHSYNILNIMDTLTTTYAVDLDFLTKKFFERPAPHCGKCNKSAQYFDTMIWNLKLNPQVLVIIYHMIQSTSEGPILGWSTKLLLCLGLLLGMAFQPTQNSNYWKQLSEWIFFSEMLRPLFLCKYQAKVFSGNPDVTLMCILLSLLCGHMWSGQQQQQQQQ